MEIKLKILLVLIMLSICLGKTAASSCVPSNLFKDLNSLENNSTLCPAVVEKWVEFSMDNYFVEEKESRNEDHVTSLRKLNISRRILPRIAELVTSVGILVQKHQNPPKFVEITVTNGGIADTAIIEGFFWVGLQPQNVLSAIRDKDRIKIHFKNDKDLEGAKIEILALNDEGEGLSLTVEQRSKEQVGRLVQFNGYDFSKRITLDRKLIIGFFVDLHEIGQSINIISRFMEQILDSVLKEYEELIRDGKRFGFVIKVEGKPEMDLNQVLTEIPEIEFVWLFNLN